MSAQSWSPLIKLLVEYLTCKNVCSFLKPDIDSYYFTVIIQNQMQAHLLEEFTNKSS